MSNFNLTSLVREHSDRVKTVRANAKKNGAVYRNILRAINRAKFSTIDASIDGYDLNVSLSGDVDDLGKIWGILRQAGLQPGKHPVAGEPIFSTFFRPRDGDVYSAGPSVHLYFSSAVCRRVQVGTKMVETPVYEVRCGEPEEAL